MTYKSGGAVVCEREPIVSVSSTVSFTVAAHDAEATMNIGMDVCGLAYEGATHDAV